jgi:hypothetical protein
VRASRLLAGFALLISVVLSGTSTAAPSSPAVDVASGVAVRAADGSIAFSGDGFTRGSVIRISVNGHEHSTVLSSQRGGFRTVLRLSGLSQSLVATGSSPEGRPRVVIASVQARRTVQSPAPSAAAGSAGVDRVYQALGVGLGSVALVVLAWLLVRLRRRRLRSSAP